MISKRCYSNLLQSKPINSGAEPRYHLGQEPSIHRAPHPPRSPHPPYSQGMDRDRGHLASGWRHSPVSPQPHATWRPFFFAYLSGEDCLILGYFRSAVLAVLRLLLLLRQTSTASSWSQSSPPDPNSKLRIRVGPAGPWPERISEDIPDRMTERMSEDMADTYARIISDRMSEYVRVYARKNVK